MATLAHLKIDPKQYRVLTGTNISQTWQFVDTGNAKLGFVAWANLVEAGKTGEAWAVPASFHPHRAAGPGAEERGGGGCPGRLAQGAWTGADQGGGLRPAAVSAGVCRDPPPVLASGA